MSVTLYPGIRRLHLLYTTRYDTLREDDVRDDLLGLKVWYSTVPNFDYTTITPLEFGVGSSVSIEDLQTNTQYYLRYAFISKIDPNTFTVSQQLTATTYDELTRVYGELTNDPVYLVREESSPDIDWSYATGTFKVWDLNTEVTGNGPVYSVVPNSATNGLAVSIDTVTGVFSATGWTGTARTARVTFQAVYDGITVLRDWNLVNGIGQDAPQLTLVAGAGNFFYKDSQATLSDTPSVTVTAVLTNLTGTPTFTVKGYTDTGTFLGSIAFTQVDATTISITNTQFHISNTISYAVVRAELGNVYDEDSLKRLVNGTDTITIDLSNPVVQLQADENGLVDPAEYAESGTVIEVYEGGTKLPVSTTLAQNSTWRISQVVDTGIIANEPPDIYGDRIEYSNHANMTADTAKIEYTIEYKTKSGVVGTRTVKQVFAKSKQGVTGSSAPLVVIKSDRLVFVQQANSTTVVPDYIDLLAQVSNIAAPTYEWSVDGVVIAGQNASTLRVNKFSDVTSKVYSVEVTGTTLSGLPVTQSASYSLYYLQEGSDAINVGVFPQQFIVTADSAGTPDSVQFPLITEVVAVRGTNIVSPSSITYSIQDVDGLTVSAVPDQPGKFQITGVTEYYASYILAVTVDGTTFFNKISANKVVDGNSAPVLNLTTTNQIFVKLKNSNNYNVASVTLTAATQNVTGDYAWYVDGVLQAGQTNSTFVLQQFAATAVKLVRCERGGVYDEISIYSIEEGSDTYFAGLTNETQVLSYSAAGQLYSGQDINSQMVVVQGATQLTSPAISFSLVSTTGGLTASINSTTGVISVTEPATVTTEKQFTATFRATIAATGLTLDRVLTINVVKDGDKGDKGDDGNPGLDGDPGLQGITSRIVYAVVSQTTSAPATPSGNTPTSPWQSTVPAVQVGQIIYYSYGRYNPNLVTVDGVAANSTTWSTPVAASVFQDLRSDNWEYTTVAGTKTSAAPNVTDFLNAPGNNNTALQTGYYITKSTGSFYGTNVYLQGQVIAKGRTSEGDIQWTNAAELNGTTTYTTRSGLLGYASGGVDSGETNIARIGLTGYTPNLSTYSAWNVGVFARAEGTRADGVTKKGIGLVATGDSAAIYASCGIASAVGLVVKSFNGVNQAASFEGNVSITQALTVTGSITSNGNVIAYNASDATLKTNLQRIQNPLEKLRNIGGYTFDWKPEYLSKLGNYDPKLIKSHDVGVLAQQVQTQLPQAVVQRQDGTLAVDYTKIIPLIIEALLELDRRIA